MRSLVVTTLLAGLLLAASGCGTDDSSAPDGDGTSAAATTSASPSPSPEPEVQEATGPRLEVPGASLRLPDDDWEVVVDDEGSQAALRAEDASNVLLSSFPQLSGSADVDLSVEQDLKRFQDRAGYDVEEGDALEIDGVEVRAIVGTSQRGPFSHFVAMVGPTTSATAVTIEIETAGAAGAHQRIVDSVLASLEWRA